MKQTIIVFLLGLPLLVSAQEKSECIDQAIIIPGFQPPPVLAPATTPTMGLGLGPRLSDPIVTILTTTIAITCLSPFSLSPWSLHHHHP